MKNNKSSYKRSGFTIVELLMVIGVIGILAGISIVSYGAVQNRSKTDALKSDLTGAASQLAADLYAKNAYPTSLAAVGNGSGVKVSNGASFEYTYNNTSNPKTFCIKGTNGDIIFSITQSGKAVSGSCPAESSNPSNPTTPTNPQPIALTTPTRSGYTNDYSATGYSFSVTPSSTIPNGSWMIIVMTYVNSNTFTPPSGWTTLVPMQTAGTLQMMVFGKIKSSSDGNSYDFTSSTEQSALNSTILWGAGANPVPSWSVGSLGSRATNGTSYTNVAPSVNALEKSLVLTISAERTSATETDVSSITNATPWYFMTQSTKQIQTVSISYSEPSTTSTTSPVTITYPNAQASNGIALQIAIPANTQ